MNSSNFVGALAALICAATYIFGIAILTTLLDPMGIDTSDAGLAVRFIVDNALIFYIWYFVIYIINGFALAALAICLGAYFQSQSPLISQSIRTIGALWATLVVGAGMVANVGTSGIVQEFAVNPESAQMIWKIMGLVENGLGGGNEIAGSVWAILIAIAGVKTNKLSKALVAALILIGISGLLTLLPQTGEIAGMIFGLGYIGLFIWISVALLRSKSA